LVDALFQDYYECISKRSWSTDLFRHLWARKKVTVLSVWFFPRQNPFLNSHP
jgi:hypothetical protein